MKLEILGGGSEDFIPIDLIAEGDDDRKICRGIAKFFMLGDLHMRIDGSCLLIEYDGENCSFSIKNEQKEVIKKCLAAVCSGRYRVLVCPSFDGCNIRFIGCRKEGNPFQKKLIESYIPPPKVETIKSVGEKIEKKKGEKAYKPQKLPPSLTGPQEICWSHPLFRNIGIQTRQKVLEV